MAQQQLERKNVFETLKPLPAERVSTMKEEQRTKALKQMLHSMEGIEGKVAYIECEDGKNAAYFAKNGFNTTAVGSSKDDLKKFRDRVKGERIENIHIVHGSALEVPLKSEEFEAAVSYPGLERFGSGSRRKAVWEMGRIVKPGGLSLVAGHFFEDDKKELVEALQDSGFSNIVAISVPGESDFERSLLIVIAKKKDQPKLPGIV